MKNPQTLLPALLGVTAVSVLGAHAATILAADTFTASSGTAVNTVNNSQAVGTGTWQSIQGATSTVMSVVPTGPTYGNFGSGNILQNTNGSANTLYRAFNPDVSPFTLNSMATGITLRLTFDFRIGNGTMTGGDNFGFGFLSKRTGTSTDNDSVAYANVDTYTATGTAGLISEFRYRTATYNMGGSGTGIAQIGTAWNETSTFAAGGIYKFQLDVTKQSDGGVLLQYYRDDALAASVLATGASTFMTAMGGVNMTGIGIRHAETTGVAYYYDNLSVTLIPEPTSGILACAFGAGLLLVRRRVSPSIRQ